MSYRSLLSFVTAAIAVTLITGCAKPPQTELSLATTALDSAKAAQADIYVAAVYSAASDSLKAANVEIEKQKSSGIFGVNYDHAKALVAAATALALDAKAKAGVEKAKVGAEVDSLFALSQASLASTRDLLKKAPKGKEGKSALVAMENEVTTTEAAINDARALKTSGDFISARDKANAGIAKLDSLKNELNKAIAKTSKPVSKKKK
jgi:hypothetical protein